VVQFTDVSELLAAAIVRAMMQAEYAMQRFRRQSTSFAEIIGPS
jgi:hypothetical protein